MNTISRVAIDIEAYENDQQCVLEIGIAVKTASSRLQEFRNRVRNEHPQPPSHEYRHLIIREYMHLRNGIFVTDNRDNFLFGTSEIVSLNEAARIVDTICSQASTVIFHAANNDLNWLDSIGVYTPNSPHIIDTQDLARELNAPLGLERLGRYLGLTTSYLHNAGNDAAYTLKVYFELVAMTDRIEEESYQLELEANRCPECGSADHSTPTAECMGYYFTELGTMGIVGDNGYE